MRTSPKAQVSLEYMVILTLIVAGIITGGPYVIRSINARFHFIDDQVQDSLREEIKQSSETNFPLPTCECQDFVAGACGDTASAGNCPGGTPEKPCCGDYQRFKKKPCFPVGCELVMPMGIIEVCENDSTCCTEYLPNGCGSTDPPCDAAIPCCRNQAIKTRTCDFGNVTESICAAPNADPLCNFSCTGVVPNHTEVCPDDLLQLDDDTEYSVATGLECTTYSTPGGPYTWTPPAHKIWKMVIRVWGGGGGGGGRQSNRAANNRQGSGGGGGGYAQADFLYNENATYLIDVGGGGAALANGVLSRVTHRVGATDTVIIRGSPGSAGQHGTDVAGGAGGGTSVNTTGGYTSGTDSIQVAGQRGARSGTNALMTGGKGGDSGNPQTGGGAGGSSCPTCPPDATPNILGSPGSTPGAGGGGGGRGALLLPPPNPIINNLTGGAGADGMVQICTGGSGSADCSAPPENPPKCELYCEPGYFPNPISRTCAIPLEVTFTTAADPCPGAESSCTQDDSAITSAQLCNPGEIVTFAPLIGAGCTTGVEQPCMAILW
ncbi:MAG: hypothetical protein Q8Q08_04985 [Candidatus Omnitrophota bacterium]|nr:hypothetical protein [Candidatus Omnitrophota bacterium]